MKASNMQREDATSSQERERAGGVRGEKASAQEPMPGTQKSNSAKQNKQ